MCVHFIVILIHNLMCKTGHIIRGPRLNLKQTLPTPLFSIVLNLHSAVEESTLKNFLSVMEMENTLVGACVYLCGGHGKGRHNWKVSPLSSLNLILQVMNFASKCKPNSKLLVFSFKIKYQ